MEAFLMKTISSNFSLSAYFMSNEVRRICVFIATFLDDLLFYGIKINIAFRHRAPFKSSACYFQLLEVVKAK